MTEPEISECDKAEECRYDRNCPFYAENCRHDGYLARNSDRRNRGPVRDLPDQAHLTNTVTIIVMDSFEHAQAQADLAKAEREAAALLAELEAKDAANATAATVHKMPSPYAPGEEPADPVKGIAKPEGWDDHLKHALDGSFKPVNLDDMRVPTNTSSHVIDFAQKIRDANKYGKK